MVAIAALTGNAPCAEPEDDKPSVPSEPARQRLPEVGVPQVDSAVGAISSSFESPGKVDSVDYQEFAEVFETKPSKHDLVRPNSPRRFESTWYTRIDYFAWQEKVDDEPFMSNDGAMPTLGWQQRHGQQRYRVELFGNRVGYSAEVMGYDVDNVTDYLGLRGEYELMWEPDNWERTSFFGGIGTRFFVRSIPDIIVDDSLLLIGYQESWWTFYPYLGAESRRRLTLKFEPFWRARIGFMAFTREHIALEDVTLFPEPGLTFQVLSGWRGPRLFVCAYFEIMAWSASKEVLNYVDGELFNVSQPASVNGMIGLQTGWSY